MENIIILDEVTSTNEYIKLRYKQLPDNVVVVAKRQTHGKGRLSRTWNSEIGNLYMSMLKKNVDRDSIFRELMNVSVSIVELLKEYGIQAYIKYPNDIIVGTKKISGILMESLGFNRLNYLIVGVGVNLNQQDFGILSNKATSVFNEVGIVENVLLFGEKLRKKIKQEKDVYKNYIQYSYVIGKQIHYQGMPYIVTGVNQDGSLKLSGLKDINVPLNEVSLEELYE